MVQYVVPDYKCVGMIDDQPLIKMNCCTKFECQEWANDIALQPKLIRNENGFMVCPVCQASYGK